MLRKGVVHTIGKLWAQKYPHCPVSVSTACTAEDMVRAVETEAFDLVICDHHFNHDESKVREIEPVANRRPTLRFDESNSSAADSRRDVRNFFANERFTKVKDDGSLLGLDALIHLATSTTLRFPTPLLMLVSGHKIDVESSLGIVVAQKPLKSYEFVTVLEQNATSLLATRRCERRQDSSTGRAFLMGGQGSQLFVLCPKGGPAAKGA